ncbi:hypothetical protein EJB05_39876 [Eragrostis curvula]|uniref:Uncharacterized protein n=1 Tax=Eragrostis curvula TaxID=38414 RepID=A0A5J9TY69_9POAL|nr:hypothetical protein EJB05_39876 [Eragrostis curvula]
MATKLRVFVTSLLVCRFAVISLCTASFVCMVVAPDFLRLPCPSSWFLAWPGCRTTLQWYSSIHHCLDYAAPGPSYSLSWRFRA